jgi:hypothetical protein
MRVPYTKSGECGDTVWQRARYGQISYPAFVPFNPNTPAQRAVRATFGAVSKRWRTLTQAQREVWIAAARTKWSKPRLGKGRLFGCQYFVKINVALANRGLPQVDLPPEHSRPPKPAVASLSCPSRFDQLPVGPTLFLRTRQRAGGWEDAPRKFVAGVSPPT